MLTISALRTKPDTYENSVDPDETAHEYEPSHQDLHYLYLIFDWYPYFQQ